MFRNIHKHGINPLLEEINPVIKPFQLGPFEIGAQISYLTNKSWLVILVYSPVFLSRHYVFDFQPGQSYYFIWAYHSSDEVQNDSFPKHSYSGSHQVGQLIPGIQPATTPIATSTTAPTTGKPISVIKLECEKRQHIATSQLVPGHFSHGKS